MRVVTRRLVVPGFAAIVVLAARCAPMPSAPLDAGETPEAHETPGRAAAAGVYPPNRRYPLNAQRRPFVIIGYGNEGRNPRPVLEQLAGKITYQRAYAAGWDVNADPDAYNYGCPWVHTGGRCDMDTWNEDYWANLHDYLSAAQDNGITVGLTIWDGHSDLPGGKFGDVSSWNSHLNVQGVQWEYDVDALAQHPDPSRTGSVDERLVYYQRRWVDRLLAEIAPYPNLIIELDNETSGVSPSWWLWWASHIARSGDYVIATSWNASETIPDNVFASDPRLHMKSYHDRSDASITATRYGWGKIIVGDADNSCANLDAASARRFAWRSVVKGGHWNDFVCNSTSFPDLQKAAYYGHLLDFLDEFHVPLWDMTRRNDLVPSGSLCMARDGVFYLVYAEADLTLDLGALPGSATYFWYDPRNGTVAGSGLVNGGAVRSFTRPGSGDWVLYVMVNGTAGVDLPPGMAAAPAAGD
jgi:hypothetical protein